MNKKIFIFLGIFMINFTCAWSENSFNNSLTSENLTYTDNENFTRWLSVNENTIVTNGYLNLSGYFAYQNFTQASDGNFTYPWVNTSLPGAIENHIEDWSDVSIIWVLRETWLYYDPDLPGFSTLLFINNGEEGYIITDSTNNYTLINYSTNNTTNTYIHINNTKVWNQTGELNSTNSPQKTSNLASTINNYISTTTAVAGYYLIPFIFHSDTAGILEYLSLVFNNNGLTENSQTYPTTSLESKTQTFTANVTYDDDRYTVGTGILHFNGDSYIGTNTRTGSESIFSADAIMPQLTTETNYTSYWTISLTDIIDTTDYNLTSHNTTVSIVNFGLCNATNNVSFWNFTVLNESNNVEINSSFKGTFTIKITGSTATNEFNFSDTTGTNSTFDFCISPGDESYTIDTNIQLSQSVFVDKFYNYEEVVVTNATREDSLYMLATGDSTSFIIHTVYVDSSDVSGAEVRVQRYYPGTSEWLTTEILTTNSVGTTVGHLLSEDSDYRFLVYLNGVSIHNSSSTKITCTVAPCTVTLTIPINVPSGTETIEDLTSTLVYNNATSKFTYTYSDTSGDFSSARLYVNLIYPSNATNIISCNETKTTTSGVIVCDISAGVNGTYQANGYITRDSSEVLDKRITASFGRNIYNAMGLDGVLWGFFILIAIVMMGVTRPSLAIVFGAVGFIALALLQIINIGALSIIGISAVAIILLMRIGRE